MIDAIVIISLFIAFTLAIKWADSKLKQDRKRVSDDKPDIDRELALMAELRRSQGLERIGDDTTEWVKRDDTAYVGRDVTRG